MSTCPFMTPLFIIVTIHSPTCLSAHLRPHYSSTIHSSNHLVYLSIYNPIIHQHNHSSTYCLSVHLRPITHPRTFVEPPSSACPSMTPFISIIIHPPTCLSVHDPRRTSSPKRLFTVVSSIVYVRRARGPGWYAAGDPWFGHRMQRAKGRTPGAQEFKGGGKAEKLRRLGRFCVKEKDDAMHRSSCMHSAFLRDPLSGLRLKEFSTFVRITNKVLLRPWSIHVCYAV